MAARTHPNVTTADIGGRARLTPERFHVGREHGAEPNFLVTITAEG